MSSMIEVGNTPLRRIQVLPDEVVNRIAAGEVVERPASAVKELLENAIDAGGDTIIVWIKEGGKSLIRIADNGTGMSEQDALLALERHATSKIRASEDLDHINQLGFRGEALSSIVAVSMLEMKTGLKEEGIGTFIRADAGQIEEVKQIAWESGTSISVRNIFYNTPGRRKFLRSNNTEMRHIVKIFKQYALGYPELSFSLYHNEQQVWELTKSSQGERIRRIFTENLFEQLVELDSTFQGIKLKGYIAKPELIKSWSGENYLYVNRRSIRDTGLRNAIISAYGTTLDRGNFPFYILSMEINPEDVDVNVHPAKWEVRFRDEHEVRLAIYESIRQRLAVGTVPRGSFFQAGQTNIPEERMNLQHGMQRALAYSHSQPADGTEGQDAPRARPETQKSGQSYAGIGVDPGKLWQVHNKYIICQVKTGISIIDQHAAHERILYERTMEMLKERGGISQHLIFPEIIELSREEIALTNELQPLLSKIGFGLKNFSNNSVVIDGVPNELRQGREKGFFRQFLDTYRDEDMRELDVYERIASSFACHAAIRSGDSLTFTEMNALIDQLFATKFPYYCPHGRPIVIHFALEDLDKKFLR